MVFTYHAVSHEGELCHDRREGYANGKGRKLLDDGLVEYEIGKFRPPVVEPETCTLLVLDIFISSWFPSLFHTFLSFSFSFFFFCICIKICTYSESLGFAQVLEKI